MHCVCVHCVHWINQVHMFFNIMHSTRLTHLPPPGISIGNKFKSVSIENRIVQFRYTFNASLTAACCDALACLLEWFHPVLAHKCRHHSSESRLLSLPTIHIQT